MFITLYLYGSMGVALPPTPPAKFNTPPHPSTNSSVFYHYKDHMNYNQTTISICCSILHKEKIRSN